MSTIKVEVPTEPEEKPKVITFRCVLFSKMQQEFEKDKREDEERENMLNAIKETEDVSAKIFRLKSFCRLEYSYKFFFQSTCILFIVDIHVWYMYMYMYMYYGWKMELKE